MPVLHLGVIDLPYVHAPSRRQRKVRAGTVTTGDVAGWLEDRYHILETYAHVHEGDIVRSLENGIGGSLENLMMGAPPSLDVFGQATSEIEQGMKDFISKNEMAALGYPGVPTKAALARAGGKASARMKRGRKSNAVAVSFIDSGLFQSSLKATIS